MRYNLMQCLLTTLPAKLRAACLVALPPGIAVRAIRSLCGRKNQIIRACAIGKERMARERKKQRERKGGREKVGGGGRSRSAVSIGDLARMGVLRHRCAVKKQEPSDLIRLSHRDRRLVWHRGTKTPDNFALENRNAGAFIVGSTAALWHR